MKIIKCETRKYINEIANLFASHTSVTMERKLVVIVLHYCSPSYIARMV